MTVKRSSSDGRASTLFPVKSLVGSSSYPVNAVSITARLLLRLPVSERVTLLNSAGSIVGGVSTSGLGFRPGPPPPLSSIGLQK